MFMSVDHCLGLMMMADCIAGSSTWIMNFLLEVARVVSDRLRLRETLKMFCTNILSWEVINIETKSTTHFEFQVGLGSDGMRGKISVRARGKIN